MNVEKLYLIRKDALARCMFLVSLMMAYFASLNPWFVWKVRPLVYIMCAGMLVFAMKLVRQTDNDIFTRKTAWGPWVLTLIYLCYDLILTEANINGLIVACAHFAIFYAIYRADGSLYEQLSTWIAKAMAVFMVFSVLTFFLYLAGFPLPHSNIEHPSGNYSFTNYYLFLLDDRSLLSFFPRFHSIALEPGHIGSALAVLLISQCGKLTRWYNLVLLFTTFLTLSLAAYVLLFVGSFLIQWMRNRPVVKWIAATIVVLSVSAVVVVNYNDGENMVNELIMMRMEVEDGELAGDNRVSDDFQKEFDGLFKSSDVVFGRGAYEEKELHGNSGYKLFIYEKGLVGTILVVIFYTAALIGGRSRRAAMSAAIIAILLFIARANPTWYFDFLGVYMIANTVANARGRTK